MDVVNYQCPNCGYSLAFDPVSGKWKCGACGSTFGLEELGSLERGAQETVETITADGEVAVYNCPSCGGRIVTDANTTATFCAFCHNPTVLPSRVKGENLPANVLPFQVPKSKAVEELVALCKKAPLTPDNFIRYARNGEITGLYVPFWLYDCDVDASIRGEADIVTTWSDSDYNYTKTDTYLVERDADMSIARLPIDGSEKIDNALMESIEPFDYSQMVDFSVQYLSGYYADSHDTDDTLIESLIHKRIETQVASMMAQLIEGYATKRLDTPNIAKSNMGRSYVMLPVWLMMAQYQGETYTFAMNGQTGKMVGKLPTDNGKLFKRCALAFIISFVVLTFILGVL